MIGSIKKRTLQDGRSVRWDFVWDEPTSGGGRRQRSRTFLRKKDAEQFQVETAHELFDGTYVKPSKRTVGEFLEAWIEEIAPPISDPSTFNSYAGIVRNHWVRLLGSIRLEGLTKADVQRAHREMIQEGTAASTLRVRQAVLTKALTRAVDLQFVKRNVASNAMLPEVEELARPAWSAADVRRFCEANVDDPRLVLWRLALDSGMRIGELLALKWVDVDWEHGSIRVRRKLVRGDDGRGWAIREGTKSRAGRRTIPLSSSTMAALRQHRSVVLQLRLEFGGEWRDHDLVFPRHDGEPQRQQTVREALDRATERAGLDRITPHVMRHTMATLLAAADVHPAKIADRMGHADVTMALKRYTHVSEEMQRDAADALADILAGESDVAVISA